MPPDHRPMIFSAGTSMMFAGYEYLSNVTMGAGRSVIALARGGEAATLRGEANHYVTVEIDVIVEYERRILNLQCELDYYRNLGRLSDPHESQTAEQWPITRLDAASVELLDSILQNSPSRAPEILGDDEGDG